jgi:hypothetical protein
MVGNGHKSISEETDQADLERDLEKARKRLTECSLDVIQHRNESRVTIEVSTSFSSPDVLRSKVRCAMNEWREVDFAVERNKGLIYDTFVTRVVLGRSALGGQSHDFPREIYLTVPGYVSSKDFESNLVAESIEINEVATDQISIKIGRGPNHFAELDQMRATAKRSALLSCELISAANEQEFDPDGGSKDCIDEGIHDFYTEILKIEIESTIEKFSLQEIIAFFGVIFGSGLILELARRVFLVKIVDENGSNSG